MYPNFKRLKNSKSTYLFQQVHFLGGPRCPSLHVPGVWLCRKIIYNNHLNWYISSPTINSSHNLKKSLHNLKYLTDNLLCLELECTTISSWLRTSTWICEKSLQKIDQLPNVQKRTLELIFLGHSTYFRKSSKLGVKYSILSIFKHLSWTVLHLECSAGLVPDREFGSRSKELQLCSVRLDHVGGPVSVTAHPVLLRQRLYQQNLSVLEVVPCSDQGLLHLPFPAGACPLGFVALLTL